LDEDEKGSIRITDGTSPSGGNPNFLIISESGLYALIFRSRKPEARRVRKWVTSEVLPAIRKSGGYALPGSGRDSLPKAALRLRPALRERVLDKAVQAARLVGVSRREEIDEMYFHFCDLVGVSEKAKPFNEEVREFYETRCMNTPGKSTRAAVLYDAFLRWRGQDGPKPSLNAFSRGMALFAHQAKSNWSMFRDVALRGD
jgi:hypothetical protein